MSQVKFENGCIQIAGKRMQIISGVVHFFRLPRASWRDRLEKAAAMGCNCIESYIFWNLTEPEKGRFRLEDNLDFEAFFRMAGELGLHVIVRPGPYTCSECDNGGLPWWLMNHPEMEVRRSNKPFLDAVRSYWSVILPKIAALQYDRGGPVIAVQIENEYGGYCHDTEYLKTLAGMAREFGITVPLFTSNGAHPEYLPDAMIDGLPLALDFGVNSMQMFQLGKKFRPDDPPFCGEFWGSWFTRWGDSQVIQRGPEEYASELDDILRSGGSVNIYMACGGTNFGFMGGANQMPGDPYKPDATTYDFDAPISEAGEITPKFHALQRVIRKYRPEVKPVTPENPRRQSYGKIPFTATARLFDHLLELSSPRKTVSPQTMEKLGQGFGFLLYRTTVTGPRHNVLALESARDRVQLFLNRVPSGIFYRNDSSFRTPVLHFPPGTNQLDLLVENLGRVNYGPYVGRDPKGIVGELMLGTQVRVGFEHYPLPLDNLEQLTFDTPDTLCEEPAFHRAVFEIGPEEEPADTFLRFPGVHGCIFVNGINLGRYWEIGPIKTLFLPGCMLHRGVNEIIVFETTGLRFPYVESTATPEFGPRKQFLDSLDQI